MVRYYMAKFDGPIRVEDIGVKCYRDTESKAEAHLGAVFVQRLSLEDWADTRAANKARIHVYRNDLWRTTEEAH